MAKGPIINMRYDSQVQVNRFKRAAKARHWSLNRFMLVAAEQFCGVPTLAPAARGSEQGETQAAETLSSLERLGSRERPATEAEAL